MSEFYTSAIQYGNHILTRGYRDGVQFKDRVSYQPYHFVTSETIKDAKTLDGRNTKRIDFSNIFQAKEFLKKYEGIDNANVFGYHRYNYNFIRDEFPDMEYDIDIVRILYMDLEVDSSEGFPDAESAEREITAVSFRCGKARVVMSCANFDPPDGVEFIKCNNELDLLNKLIKIIENFSPDIISGWNVEFYDIPYMVNRIRKIIGADAAKRLSPWGVIHEYVSKGKFSDQQGFKLLGITTIDLMQAYIKFTFKNQESFSLNHIAHVELGEEKIDYSEYESLHDLYSKNPQKFLEYNLRDSDLVHMINEKTGLIEQIITLAYSAKVNYSDAFTSVLLWEVIISNYLFEKGIVVPGIQKKNKKFDSIMGAFVKEPRPGKYNWVVGEDLDSLYPHLIMQYNISPETIDRCNPMLRQMLTVDDIINGKLKDCNEVVDGINAGLGYTPNGAFFRNNVRGFLPELMDSMYNDRKVFKKKMIQSKDMLEKEKDKSKRKNIEKQITRYNNMQMAKKICLNSAYGAMSNVWFMFFDTDMAEAITYSGQLAIKWISNDLNKWLSEMVGKDMDYIIANDTDSCYINFNPLVKKFFNDSDPEKIVNMLVKFSNDKVNPFINKSYDEMVKLTGAYENKMSMKVENISTAGIWKAKKKYALNVWWDEGVFYEKPKLKIKGLSAIQSSTPQICRDSIKECISIIIEGERTELAKKIGDFEKKFKSSSFEEIARTASANGLRKWSDSETIYRIRTPIHVKGSLIYNKLLFSKNVEKTFQIINAGDKVKYCYLLIPNPTGDNVISAYNILPKEFGLHQFLDYQKQYEKVFFTPVNDISKLVGWDMTVSRTLDELFA